MRRLISRRKFITSATVGSLFTLSGCDRLGSNETFRSTVLASGEWLAYRMHRLIGASALAREYSPADISPDFRINGNSMPADKDYQRHLENNFANWHLQVGGLVAAPGTWSLTTLKALPSRTQITRHDCVEGWSAIGKWTGVPLSHVLDAVRLKPEARYIVFYCADDFSGTYYYESLDLIDAFHPQTILAYNMNDSALPVGHGAPLRLRVERQLGYKHAKFIMRIEAVDSLNTIGEGKGGFWEDAGGYEWYAGI